MASEDARVHLVRPSDAAAILGLSRPMIYKLIGEGRLPAVRIGGAVRIRSDVLERVMEEGIPLGSVSEDT